MNPYPQQRFGGVGSVGNPPKQKPTVVRSMHFYRWSDANGVHEGPLAAIIVAVHADDTVNLTGWDNRGVHFHAQHIVIIDDSDPIPLCSYCKWPPRV